MFHVISRKTAYSISAVFLIIGLIAGVGYGSTYLSERKYSTTTLTATVTQTASFTSSFATTQKVVSSAVNITHTVTEIVTSTTSYSAINASSTISFNGTNAKLFLESLDTQLGLLETFKESNQIFVAGDQALDYNALVKLGNQSLADNISSSLSSYGGLYSYWNAVFVVMNVFPSSWNFSFPVDYHLTNEEGYSIMVTRFTQPGSLNDYAAYADLELYYSLYSLHAKNYSQAVSAFETANSMWDGYGFADKAYNSSANGYDSYKLAVDLIAFKALLANPNTEANISSYNTTISEVRGIMSILQASNGGVITNYESVNGTIVIPPNTFENGETTSLFVLAE
jgi:biopolymer transport protein ExbD